MYRWIGGVLSGVIFLVLLVSGCGEGSEASSSITKTEFVKQVNAACEERKKEWEAAAASYQEEVEEKGAESKRAVQREIAEEMLENSMVPALNKQLERLEELGAPDGSEKQVEKMLQALSKGIEGVEDKGIEALLESKFATFEKRANALGLRCAQ